MSYNEPKLGTTSHTLFRDILILRKTRKETLLACCKLCIFSYI